MRRLVPLLLMLLVGAAATVPAAHARPDALPTQALRRDGAGPRFADDHLLVQADSAVLADHGLHAGRRVGKSGFVVVDTAGRSVVAVRDELAADPRVQAVELDVVRRAFATTPNDDFFQPEQDELRLVRLPEAWDVLKADSSQVIAVLDTGVDRDHPDLPHAITGKDFVFPGDNDPHDEEGHGTMVAGIATAITNNDRGVAGASWGAQLMPLRVLNAAGRGFDSDIAAAITYAADNGATVINLSLGGPDTSTTLESAVAYAASKDVVVVAAAGNDENGMASYPAAYDSVLAVGAIDENGDIASFSQHGSWVDVAAPGTDIASTANDEVDPFSDYAAGDGTSFAAPITSGVAALVRAQHPDWTATQVVDRIQQTARNRGPTGVDDSYGFGVLDAYAAVGGPTQAAVAPAGGDGDEPNSVPAAAKLVGTGSTSATISPEGDVDWYSIDLPASRYLTATVTPASSSNAWQGMGPLVDIYAPDGSHLGSAVDPDPLVDGRTDETQSVRVQGTSAGRYTVRVASETGSRSAPSGYTLGLAVSSSPPSGFTGNNGTGHAWAHDTNPRGGAANVDVGVAPTVTFAQAVDAAGRDAVRLVHGRTRATVPVTRTYDSGTRVLTLRPTASLDGNTPYQLRVREDPRDVAYFVTGAAPAPPSPTTTTTTTTTITTTPAPTPTPSPTRSGYWMVDSRGFVYAFGDARHLGGLNGARGNVVDLEPSPSGNGYWLLTAAGEIFAYGDARHAGQPGGLAAGESVTSMSAHPGGAGYWVFTTRGRVFAFGGAPHRGDMAAVALNGPVLDSVATPTGQGYYMVASDGGIFAFGDARFRGSMGGHRLNAPVQSLVPDADNDGYWLVASDGGIFAFAAPFRGSMGATRLNRPVTGMVRFGDGYLMVGEDGGIFNFSSKPFHGSLGANPPAQPVVAVAALEG